MVVESHVDRKIKREIKKKTLRKKRCEVKVLNIIFCLLLLLQKHFFLPKTKEDKKCIENRKKGIFKLLKQNFYLYTTFL